jgi:hypothetical protein
MKKKSSVAILVLFICGITIPFVIAWFHGQPANIFNGFLINQVDGYSYLAKMEQGQQGNWLFELPFTSEKTSGVFLFAYYIFLGHICKWTGISILLMFHTARIINSIFLAFVLYQFIRQYNPVKSLPIDWVWAITLLGSGMGWLAATAGIMTSDLWVAEAYPFLASFTNPHFPLSIALMLSVFIFWQKTGLKKYPVSIGCGLLLAILQPFCDVIILVVFGLDWFMDVIQKKDAKAKTISMVVYSLASLPLMILYLYTVQTDPLIKVWNAQNVTASPQLWDLFLSFSPAIILASIGIIPVVKQHQPVSRILWIWAIVGFGICLIPISLQRRFLIGIYIPMTILAAVGLNFIMDNIRQPNKKWIKTGYTVLVIPTNLFLMAVCFLGISSTGDRYYITAAEQQGLVWLKQNGIKGGVVLSDPITSLYIPAFTGLKVVYAHPYETPYAKEKLAEVEACLSGWNRDTCNRVIKEEHVNYIWISQRVKLDGFNALAVSMGKKYSSGQVAVYEVEP